MRPLAIAALLLFFVLPAFAADPEQARALVRKLGDNSFEVREKAAAALLELGPAAEDALREGLKAEDAEVRLSCARLLDKILTAGREARIKAFLADTEDRHDHGLTGWSRFRTIAGKDAAARKLFVAVLKANASSLEEAEKNPKDTASKMPTRAEALTQALITPKMDEPAFNEAVTLVFIAADPKVTLEPAAFASLCSSLEVLSNRKELRKRWTDSPATRKLLLAFLERRDDSASLDLALPLATAFEVKEARDWAVKIATTKTLPATTRGLALLLAGRIGDRDLVPKVEPLLTDTTSLGTKAIGSVTLTTELRDVALAALVQMSGGKVEEYGYPYLDVVPGLKSLPAPVCLGFANPAKREAALKKWQDAGRK